MEMNNLSAERKLILLSAIDIDKDDNDGKNYEEFRQILENNCNWAEILYQANTHRTICMLYYNLEKHNLISKAENEMVRLFENQIQYYRGRNNCYLNILGEIMNAFRKYKVIAPILKGNLLATLVYPRIELRSFSDLDLFINLADANEVVKALEELGYVQGEYNPATGVIEQAPRNKRILHQVSTHELYEFRKMSGNNFAPMLQVDVNHNILWQGNCPYNIPAEDLIGRAVAIDIAGTTGYMFDYIDNIIQLCAHLYKEATMMMWITDLRDMKIYKFADIYLYIKRFNDKIDWQEFILRIKHYGIEKIIYYCFHYVEKMFGSIMPENIMNAVRPADLTFLNEYGIENEKPALWEYDFFTRLFETNRILTIEKDKCKKLDEFMKIRK